MVEISLHYVSVSFQIYDGVSRSLKNRIVTASTGGHITAGSGQATVVRALNEITFTLEHGDRLALIGHNGAGKTTLLRVIAGIYTPMRGRVRRVGKVAPLFDTGFGMDPEATGYENIRLRGLYLGLSKKEIDDRIDEIADFAELGSFLGMPLRTYSAGMQTRLAFAVSTSRSGPATRPSWRRRAGALRILWPAPGSSSSRRIRTMRSAASVPRACCSNTAGSSSPAAPKRRSKPIGRSAPRVAPRHPEGPRSLPDRTRAAGVAGPGRRGNALGPGLATPGAPG